MRSALAALVAAASACAGTGAQQPPVREEPTLAGTALRCAAGEEAEELGTGGTVQVIELWATWCAPCVKALPLWQALAAREDLEILAVSIDDDPEAPLRFVRERGIELPVLWDPFAQKIAQAVPLGGVVPTTLVIDCEGRVRHQHEGFEGPEVIEEVAAEVAALRRESSCTGRPALARCAP